MLRLAGDFLRRYKEDMVNSDNTSTDSTFLLDCEGETLRLAEDIWKISRAGDIIALWGDLGVGKTAFARGFIQAANGPAEEVPSPTFTLLQIYESPITQIYHFDLYRIENEDEVLELGIEDAFADGISLIEWPANMGHWLPYNRLDLTLSSSDTSSERRVKLQGYGPSWQARLSDFRLNR